MPNSVYDKLGVRRVINAWGVATELGGWTLSPAVASAMEEANRSNVEMKDLLQRSGDFIAELLGVEAAYVTSGGAAAQALSVAACMAGTDPDKIAQLPDSSGMKNEVLIQKRNVYMFSRCYTLTGAKLVEVGDDDGTSREQLEAAIGPRTAAVAYYIQPPFDQAILSLDETVEVARARGVPALADACSQLYPLDYFRRNAQSADLVSFGAKYIGAPHSAGFVCGKKDLVEAVAAHSFVSYHYDGGRAIGRAMKVDRQEIAGVVAAMDAWFTMDHEERISGYDSRMSKMERGLEGIVGVKMERITTHHYVPYMVHLVLDSGVLGFNADEVRSRMDTGNPRVWVGARGEDTVTISVHTLNEGEDDVVIQRLRRVLTEG
jgi:L-seryl-tRNA(Ser) seleniumtransferase